MMNMVNTFLVNVPILYPLEKTWKPKVFWFVQGVESGIFYPYFVAGSYRFRSIHFRSFDSLNASGALICGALRDLVAFVKFKKREKHPWRSVNCNFTKINIPPWVFLTFFKLYKCYQIAQRTTYRSYPQFDFSSIGI